jgi:hypothetical protein
VAPYRAGELTEALEAPTRTHPLRLEVAPRHVVLVHGPRRVTITDDYLVVADTSRRGRRRKPFSRRGARLFLARDVPHDDVGLWIASDDERAQRVFGVEPADLIAEDGLVRLRALDRLVARLRAALAPRGGPRAVEIGRGLDKVLLLDHGDHLVAYVRPLFRAEARRAVDVHRDGRVIVAGDPPVRVRCRSRFGVTLLGDYVRFADPRGVDLARVPVRWVCREDREELARRFGDMLHVEPPLLTAGIAAAESGNSSAV